MGYEIVQHNRYGDFKYNKILLDVVKLVATVMVVAVAAVVRGAAPSTDCRCGWFNKTNFAP